MQEEVLKRMIKDDKIEISINGFPLSIERGIYDLYINNETLLLEPDSFYTSCLMNINKYIRRAMYLQDIIQSDEKMELEVLYELYEFFDKYFEDHTFAENIENMILSGELPGCLSETDDNMNRLEFDPDRKREIRVGSSCVYIDSRLCDKLFGQRNEFPDLPQISWMYS